MELPPPTIGDHADVVFGVLLGACMLYLVHAGVGLDEVLVDLVELFVEGGGDGCDLLLHLGDHGGAGHRIELVSGYQVSQPCSG